MSQYTQTGQPLPEPKYEAGGTVRISGKAYDVTSYDPGLSNGGRFIGIKVEDGVNWTPIEFIEPGSYTPPDKPEWITREMWDDAWRAKGPNDGIIIGLNRVLTDHWGEPSTNNFKERQAVMEVIAELQRRAVHLQCKSDQYLHAKTRLNELNNAIEKLLEVFPLPWKKP